MKSIIKKLCLDLVKAETTEEAISLLKESGYWNSEDFWHPYGDNTCNAQIIHNQAGDSVRSLVEKLTNSQDQLLILESLKRGIDPEGPEAPRSMKEATEKFFRVPNGELTDITGKERTKLADLIKLIATGSKTNPNYIILDQGTGQSATTMPKTILSLISDNKIRIPFTQGVYNQGGSAALAYTDLQLIISKQHPSARNEDDRTSENFCFTVVRKQKPKSNEKLPVYTYLAPMKDELFNFQSNKVSLGFLDLESNCEKDMEFGNFIKLFDYKIKPNKLKSSIATTNLSFKIASLMPDISLPIRICERRIINYKDQRDHNIIGLKTRMLDDVNNNLEDKNINGTIKIDAQKISYSIFTFKKDAKVGNYKDSESVILSLNGQNMATIGNNIFERESLKGLKNLKRSILIIADFSNLTSDYRNEIFMPSRDRLRKDSSFYMRFEKELLSLIAKDPYLKKLSYKRFREELKERTKDNRDLENIIQSVIKNDPTLSDILYGGKSKINSPIIDDDIINKPSFIGLRFPTYFEPIKIFKRQHPKKIKIEDHSFSVKFKTNAQDDYFHRNNDKGHFSITMNGENIDDYNYKLHDGKFTLHIHGLQKILNIDETTIFQWTVNDVSRVDPFQGEFYIKLIEGKSKNGTNKHTPKGPKTLTLPKIVSIYREGWNNENNFDDNSALFISGGKNKTIYYINCDNKYLINEIKKKPETKLVLTKCWEIALTLMGMAKMNAYEKKNKGNEYDIENRIAEDTKDYSPILIPLVLRIAKLASYHEDISKNQLKSAA